MGTTEAPDLIVFDPSLFHGDGRRMLAKFKAQPETRDVPVIVLTRETPTSNARQWLEAGAAAFVAKPVRWPDLFAEMIQFAPFPASFLLTYRLPEPAAHTAI
jgi:CheY-like chemotaxis protein